MDMFEKASKFKYRFASQYGSLLVEDLYDLGLEPLNTIAVNVHKEIKSITEVSFIEQKDRGLEHLETKLEILKHIIEAKQKEIKDKENELIRKSKKEKIEAIIAKKEVDALEEQSLEDLKALLADL
jgi:hypothetical protein